MLFSRKHLSLFISLPIKRFLAFHQTKSFLSVPKLTMKIDSTQFKSLFTPELQKLSELFQRHGHELRIAGGPVRDLLLGIVPSDMDFATTATPTQMKKMFEAENIRMINKKGEGHGTITCRINDKENFEITTLRIDVVCDGRRAEVNFTTDWMLDAHRRDLTINSLFLGMDGTVYDYTGGLEDIRKRRIAFVGDPQQRIQEDYLRILRYFRFFGRFAKDPNDHEKENIDAIIKWKDGLKNVSGERIWMELSKILVGRFAAPIMEVMLGTCGLNRYLSLPEDANLAEFRRVVEANINAESGKVNAEPSTTLSSLLNDHSQAMAFQRHTKYSNNERFLCEFIVQRREEATKRREEFGFFKYLLLDEIFENGTPIMETARQRCVELLKYVDSKAIREQICEYEIEKFPVDGIDLMEAKVPRGPRMRLVRKYLYEMWKRSDQKMSKSELLEHCNDEIGEGEEQVRSKKPKLRNL